MDIFLFNFLTAFCTAEVAQLPLPSIGSPRITRGGTMITIAFKDRSFFTCNSILHEARTMFGLDLRYTLDSTSPSAGSWSSDGVHEGTSKYSDSTPSPHEKSINDNVSLPHKRPKDTRIYLQTFHSAARKSLIFNREHLSRG
jgi:hypothetical protein